MNGNKVSKCFKTSCCFLFVFFLSQTDCPIRIYISWSQVTCWWLKRLQLAKQQIICKIIEVRMIKQSSPGPELIWIILFINCQATYLYTWKNLSILYWSQGYIVVFAKGCPNTLYFMIIIRSHWSNLASNWIKNIYWFKQNISLSISLQYKDFLQDNVHSFFF